MMKYSDINSAQGIKVEIEKLKIQLRECTQPYSDYYWIGSRADDLLIKLHAASSNQDEATAFIDVKEAIRKMLQGRIDSRLAELRELGVVIDE